MTPTRMLGLLTALLLLPACGDPTPAPPDPRRGELVALVDQSATVIADGARVDVVREVTRQLCPRNKKASRWAYEKFVHLPESEIEAGYDRAYHHWGKAGYHVERSPRRKFVSGRNDTFVFAATPERTPERNGFLVVGGTACPDTGSASPSSPSS